MQRGSPATGRHRAQEGERYVEAISGDQAEQVALAARGKRTQVLRHVLGRRRRREQGEEEPLVGRRLIVSDAIGAQ